MHIILCIKSIILNIYIHKNAINVVLIAINVVFIAINVVLIAINVVLIAINVVLIAINVVFIAINVVLIAINVVFIAINVVLIATTWRDLSNVNSAYKGWFYWIWGIKSCWERWRRWWTRFYIIIRVIYNRLIAKYSKDYLLKFNYFKNIYPSPKRRVEGYRKEQWIHSSN